MEDNGTLTLLEKTLDFTATGIIPSEEEREQISGQLAHLQERYDLTQVALTHYHIGRLKEIAGKIKGIEEQIFDADGKMSADIPLDIRVKVWQELLKQLKTSGDFVDSKATVPTASSPERMDRVANNPEVGDEKVKSLAPSSRRRVRELLRKLEVELEEKKVVDVEVTGDEAPPSTSEPQ